MSEQQGQKLDRANSFEELEIYRRARELSREVFKLSLRLPKDERFSLTDQIRRSSGSVGANIAEAWAKRRYPKHFVSKLTDADGEQLETIHWLNIIANRTYIPATDLEKSRDFCAQIGRMLGAMVGKPNAFAPPSS